MVVVGMVITKRTLYAYVSWDTISTRSPERDIVVLEESDCVEFHSAPYEQNAYTDRSVLQSVRLDFLFLCFTFKEISVGNGRSVTRSISDFRLMTMAILYENSYLFLILCCLLCTRLKISYNIGISDSAFVDLKFISETLQ